MAATRGNGNVNLDKLLKTYARSTNRAWYYRRNLSVRPSVRPSVCNVDVWLSDWLAHLGSNYRFIYLVYCVSLL